MDISEHTLTNYLIHQTTLFNKNSPLIVTALSNEKDKYVDGYINYLYTLRQGKKKFVLKYSKKTTSSGISLMPIDPKRNHLEYMTYQLRSELAPQMVPMTYFSDPTAHLFIMEDLSYLEVLRFSLCHRKQFPRLGKQVGEYLARTHLATSQFKLSKENWISLVDHFQNSNMREIITKFILKPAAKKSNIPLEQAALLDIFAVILKDSTVKKDWDSLIDKLSNRNECLIHGDFHTSNIFVSPTSIKVIDMEYAMTGPFSYDLGYFLANILSQYAAFSVRGDDSMCAFLLQVIKDVYKTYFIYFSDHVSGNQRERFLEIFQDSLGYLAMANINRIANLGEFPDFDCLETSKERFLAKGISMSLAQNLMKHRKQLTTADEVCCLISEKQNIFFNN